MTPDSTGWTFNVLYDFCLQYHCPDGGDPSAVIMDGLGNLYGTALAGGSYGDGIVFELMPGSSGWDETILHSFDGSDGYFPYAALTFDKAGDLYGTLLRRCLRRRLAVRPETRVRWWMEGTRAVQLLLNRISFV